MNTRRTILAILGAIVLASVSGYVVLVVVLGPKAGTFTALLCLVVVALLYRQIIQPWHSTWGATREEIRAHFPGDDLVPVAASTTRAITIDAPPVEVWPWLEQIGFGRAGWYSYDWIDNDGEPSANRIVDDLQGLAVGDRIPMTPDLGFVVTAIDPPTSLVSLSDDRSTSWCLLLGALPGEHTRLVSRFRTDPPVSPAALLWVLVSDPGAFIMERRMLKGIRSRAGRRRASVA